MSTVEPLDTASRNAESQWRRLPLAARIAIVVIGALIGLNLLARFWSESTGGGNAPSGRPSSAYGTQADGLAAYADLLSRESHRVERTRGSLQAAALDPGTTLVVLDPDTISTDDANVLLTFLVNGGRLVIGGTSPSYLIGLRDSPPEWAPRGPTRWRQVAPSLAPITTVESAGAGSFLSIGTSTALVGSSQDALVTEAPVGLGTVVFLADPSPLQNRLLGTADNAALGLALVGAPGRTVVFPEGVHGYGPSRGLAAIPTHWKIALLGLAIAGLVLMWARGRRLGPPEDRSRPLPPPRAASVDAVGSTLARARQPDAALHGIAERVRAHIDARAIPGADGAAGATTALDRMEFVRRAHAAGLSDEEIDAVLAPITNESVLAVGRALSRVVSSTGREGQ
jgi:transposase